MKVLVRPVQRRSIVTFEKWLDGEIAEAQKALQGLLFEAQAVEVRRGVQQVRLETLEDVKAKLGKTAFPPVEETAEEAAG
jgi:hypothetical protein